MSDLLDAAQTVALVGAFLVSWIEVRNSRKERTHQNYLEANARYAESVGVLLQNKALHDLYKHDSTYKHLKEDERQQVLYCDWVIALCETVWTAEHPPIRFMRMHRVAAKWPAKLKLNKRADQNEWQYWREWLVWMHEVSPAFQKTWIWVGGRKAGGDGPRTGREYDEKFLEDVDAAITLRKAKAEEKQSRGSPE